MNSQSPFLIQYPIQSFQSYSKPPITHLMKKRFTIVIIAAFLAAFTAEAAPTLNSYPTAAATLYLDFDGHDVNSSMWNFGTPFSCLPAVMTDEQITEAFNRVAEDFRPFNINVTTELAKFLAAPIARRMRVIVTPTSSWYAGVAGIAYVTSFTWGDDTPAFVFSDRLANNPRRVAEAISHESGHTLGLYHQSNWSSSCTLVSAYHTGIGNGETSWGPIMGNAASRNNTQWNAGPIPNGCSAIQDNLNVITTTNGFGYRPDDHADLYTSATVINTAGISFSKSGVIATNSDKDYFRIDVSENGKLKLNAIPFGVGANNSGANLDVKLMLQDSRGNTLGTYEYSDSLHAKIDTTLNAGTYYLIIDGTGNVNSQNDYGSLGAYTIEGSMTPTTNTNTTINTNGNGTGTGNAIVAGNMISGSKTVNGNKLTFNGIKSGEAITLMYATEEGKFTDLAKPSAAQSSYLHETQDGKTYIYQLRIVEKTGYVKFSNQVKISGNTPASAFKVIKQAQQPIMVNASTAYDFQIIDNFGHVISAGKASAGTKTFDVRNYPTGIYNIRLMNADEQRVEKFMNK